MLIIPAEVGEEGGNLGHGLEAILTGFICFLWDETATSCRRPPADGAFNESFYSVFLCFSCLWHHIHHLVPHWRSPGGTSDVLRLLPVRRLGRSRALHAGGVCDLVLPGRQRRHPVQGEQLLLLQTGEHGHSARSALQPRQERTSLKAVFS